jgi:hypothetical protein
MKAFLLKMQKISKQTEGNYFYKLVPVLTFSLVKYKKMFLPQVAKLKQERHEIVCIKVRHLLRVWLQFVHELTLVW